MIQNAALDVAIGLILMYLMLSLVCTVVNEYVATKLKLRAGNLASGLQEILDDPWVRQNFYAHGLIAGTSNAVAKSDNLLSALIWKLGNLPAAVEAAKVPDAARTPPAGAAAVAAAPAGPAAPTAAPDAAPAGPTATPVAAPPDEHPSYISGKNFATALLGSLDTSQPVPGFAEVEATVASMNNSKLRTTLLTIVATAKGDVDKLRQDIATWFDDSMERLSGAYKRHLKLISIIVALIVAFLFNADTFRVASTLWNDPNLRGQVLQAAENMTKNQPEAESEDTKLSDVRKTITDAEDKLRPLPIGWNCGADASLPSCVVSSMSSVTFVQILGWIVTALALSLGAPFWFDLLSKFVNIRGTGNKPDRADAKK